MPMRSSTTREHPPPPGLGSPTATHRPDPWTFVGSALIQLVPPQDLLRLVPKLEKALSTKTKAATGSRAHPVEVVAQPGAEDTFGADKWSTTGRWVVLVAAGDDGRTREAEEQELEVKRVKRLLSKWSGESEIVVLRLADKAASSEPGPGTGKVMQSENGRKDEREDVTPVPVFPLPGLDLVNEGAYAAIYPARHARVLMNGRAWPTMALFTYGWSGEANEGGACFESKWTFERRTLKDLRTGRLATGKAQLQVRASGPFRLLQTEIRLSSEGEGTFDAEVRVVRKQPSSPYSWTLHPLAAAPSSGAESSSQAVSLSFPWEIDETTTKCALPALVETWTTLVLEDVHKKVKTALLVIHRVRSLSLSLFPVLLPFGTDAKGLEYQVRFDVSGSGETHLCRSKLIAAGTGSSGGGAHKSARGEEEHAVAGCFGGLNCMGPRQR
ncbi:hypothetical protein JCM5296_006935 [Sporobolomyces johnsonii]